MKRIASIAAAGLFMSGVAAQSADLGGNCCADLEERVAELEKTTARKGNRKMSLTVYGQVNKAILHTKDIVSGSDTRVIDNGVSGSRFGFRGKAKINSDLSVGFKLELGVNENGDSDSISVRYSDLYAEGKLGRLSVGQGDMASNGAAETDLGSTSAGTLLSLGPVDTTYATSLSPFDGGRAQRVRYDTPTIGGFVLSAAWGASDDLDADDVYDVAIRYSNEFGGFRVAAAAAYRDEGDDVAKMASASAQHMESGMFLSAAYGRYEIDGLNVNLDAWHIKGGISKKMNSLGKTTAYLEYADVDEINLTFYGLGISQNIDAAASELYAGVRVYDVDGDDAVSVLGGLKVKF